MNNKFYTRQAFTEWLRALPPSEPFCPPHVCPIAASGLAITNNGETSNYLATQAEPSLTMRIDAYMLSYHPGRGGSWEAITPREVLILIDELENRT